MAIHDIDGLFFPLLDSDVAQPERKIWQDEVVDRVREAAEQEGRVFAIE